MNAKLIVFLVLVVGVFLIGCSQSPTGDYSSYSQPQQQGQQQNQYVGGGCGVAAEAGYVLPSAGQSSGL